MKKKDIKITDFNPEMMGLARKSRGITQRELAKRLSISPAWLSKVEGGIKKITIEQLIRSAELLDYPIEFFMTHRRIFGPGISELFHRKRRSVPLKVLDMNQAQMEIRRMHLSDLLNGVDIGGINIPVFDLNEFNGNVQDIARTVRALWKLPDGPIYDVTRTIEEARGIIIPFNFRSNKIDATSCWPPNMPPLFFANITTPGDRLRFTLCHELGHLVTHQESPNPNMENQANEFAAEFLMPQNDIKPYLDHLSIDKLASLKPFWKVSMAALLKRAKDLGIITSRHYKTLWIQMGKYGYRIHEPFEVDIPVQKPSLYEDIIGVYSKEMQYNLSDIAQLLRMHKREVCQIYFGADSNLQDSEAQAAVKEAERILGEYRR